jgi:NADH:ubiquinone oxidoreductase subunit 6 (subunit J)
MSVAWHNLLFWLLAVAACGSAVAVVLTQNIVRMAFWLLIALAAVGGLFFLLGADFVGAAQLLVYVGGTLVLLIFGVMLTASGPFVSLKTGAGGWVLAAVVGGGLLAVVALATTNARVEWSGVTRRSLDLSGGATAAVDLPARLTGIYLRSDQAVTLRTNDPAQPADTHELAPDEPLVWAAAPKPTSTALGLALLGAREDPAPAEVSEDEQAPPLARFATSLYLTNETDQTAHVELRFSSSGGEIGGKTLTPGRKTGYLLPFEIVSVHLLVVLIGAAYLARAKRRAQQPPVESLPA